MSGPTSAARGLIGTIQSAAANAAQPIAALQTEAISIEIARIKLISCAVLRLVREHSRRNPESFRLDWKLILLLNMRNMPTNQRRVLCLAAAVATIGWMACASAQDPETEMQAGLEAWQAGDMIGAMNHYQVAADAGLAQAQAKLGYIYDVSNQDEMAVRWYREASMQHDPDGEFGLGEMYAKGEGVDQDFDVAIEMFMRAAVGGQVQACRVLANAYEVGALDRDVDEAEALRWLMLAADGGDANAMQRIASLYRDGGLGVKPDLAVAEQWQTRADLAQEQ